MPQNEFFAQHEAYMAVFDPNVPRKRASNLIFYPPDYDAGTNTWGGGRPMGEYDPTPRVMICWRPRKEQGYSAAEGCRMARVLKPPAPIALAAGERSVFLAGSIEMGQAEDWQAAVEQALADLPVAILNPRRDEWDPSWEQSIGNPLFRCQVEWELDGLVMASVVAMYFAPSTKAPITLLELGLMARSGKLVVCCPPGYWRRGNVEVVCARYGVPLVAGLPELVQAVHGRLFAEPGAAVRPS